MEVFTLVDALNLVVESSMHAEFAGRPAVNRGLETSRPKSGRSDMRECLFLQLLFFLDSRQRLGVRFRVSGGDAQGYCTIFRALDRDGMGVGKSSAAIRCGFQRELASGAGGVNAHARKPVPGIIPL